MSPSKNFGEDLLAHFTVESAAVSFSEVQQFRALIRSFRKVGENFDVEEYHGPKHQVYFNGQGAWARSPARCELCDVLILAYSLNGGFRARLTFLQAKLSKDKHTSLCSGFPSATDKIDFKANLEQWDLLSRRPDILPVPPFKAHPRLLKDSLLASVGSFGVFHKKLGGSIDFFYASADTLTVVGSPTTKQGRLTTAYTPRQRIENGLLETTFCCCLPVFGAALYDLEIGTPVQPIPAIAGVNASGSFLGAWLRSVLSFYIEMEGDNSVLAREIREFLPRNVDGDGDEFPASIPTLVLIRSDARAPEVFSTSTQQAR
ncbi:MAG: hypothetical protein Q8K29_01320 [Polaromonas sp.]|nr:hypothetical protein [Polaromonas sp.]